MTHLVIRLLGLSVLLMAPAINIAGQMNVSEPLTLIVMDPLAAPLACDCVQGYAQRRYEKLGEFLQQRLSREVTVVWGESLEAALEKSHGKADLVIGKYSVVLADAKELGKSFQPMSRLTDLKDKVDQTGLFVVRSHDPAKTVADLKGYRILFGPRDCAEKSAAPMALLKKQGISFPQPEETAPSCSNAAVTLMELPTDAKAAAVISSYAGPLLEGCGKVKKGDLRVIGESAPVPFITLFIHSDMSEADRKPIAEVLDDVGLQAQLLIDLETASGFVPWTDPEAPGNDLKKSSRVSETSAKKKS